MQYMVLHHQQCFGTHKSLFITNGIKDSVHVNSFSSQQFVNQNFKNCNLK
jgi:hypothetical protein